MSGTGVAGSAQTIGIQAFDGSTTEFPVAYIFDSSLAIMASIPLTHKIRGFYATLWTPTLADNYFITIVFYSDVAHTIENPRYQIEGFSRIITDYSVLLSGIAAKVWDETLAGNHTLANSAGNLQTTLKASLTNITNELVSNASHSLGVISQKITDTSSVTQTDVALNKTTIDSLAIQTANMENSLVLEHSSTRQDIFNHDANMNARTDALGVSIGVNGAKIDSVTSQITSLHQQTKFVILIPQKMVRPDIGSKVYQFFISNYDNNGIPNNTDVVPTIKLYRADGTVFLTETAMTQLGVNIGQYVFDFTLNVGTSFPTLRAEFKITENGQQYLAQRVSEIVAFDGDSAALQAQINTIDNTTANMSSLLTGTSGLSQLKTEVLTNRSDIGLNGSSLGAIQAKTDLIINNPVSLPDLNTVSLDIAALPSGADITASLLIQTTSLKGADGVNLTDINNNQRGTDNALLANDPRVAFLDAAISSRSGHTLTELWNFASRTLTTSAPLSSVEVAKIWDYLVSNISAPNSVGKLIKDTLDEPISTRGLTATQLAASLGPIALEATVGNIVGSVITQNNQNELKLNTITSVLDLIKPQTDKIVNGGAVETTVVSQNNATQALVNGLEVLLNTIKSKTDNLPVDPSAESTLAQIPTNPLETNDPRLNNLTNLINLDATVSSRATPGDIPLDYAKANALELLSTSNNTHFNDLQLSINNIPGETYFNAQFADHNLILTKLDDLGGSGFVSATHSLVAIKDSIPTTPLTLSASDVWNYNGRSLTSFPDFATTTTVSTQAQSVIENLNNYRCNMTTTLKTIEDIQEVFCWLDLNNQTRVDTLNARIAVNDGVSDIWNGVALTPDSRGVFKISKSSISTLIGTADRNFIMSITIELNGNDYHTVQPFYTV